MTIANTFKEQFECICIRKEQALEFNYHTGRGRIREENGRQRMWYEQWKEKKRKGNAKNRMEQKETSEKVGEPGGVSPEMYREWP